MGGSQESLREARCDAGGRDRGKILLVSCERIDLTYYPAVGMETSRCRWSRGIPREAERLQVSLFYLFHASCRDTRFFSEERVRKGAEKLSKFLNAKQQGRLDGFFTVQPKAPSVKNVKGKKVDAKGAAGSKRKVGVESTFQMPISDLRSPRPKRAMQVRVRRQRRRSNNRQWTSQ